MKPSFRAFLLNEDLATDVLTLQQQISQLQTKKTNATKPMDMQIQQLTAQLALKQKQLTTQANQKPATPPPAPPGGTAPINNAAAGQTQSQ